MSNNFSTASFVPERKYPRLPQPLTVESLRGLMRTEAYRNTMHPQFPTYRRIVQQGFEILYPGQAQYDVTGKMIDTDPLPPHFVAKQVEQTNAEIAAMEGTPGDTTQIHVQSHTRDAGKVEVSDYWRNAPGQGGEDGHLSGQSGADDLPPGGEPPKGAFVAADPDKLVRDWTGTRQGPNEAEKFECVGLVKAAVPEIGSTKTWREGEKIIGPGNPPLEPGTAIATFIDGKYPSLPTGNHAAIFLGYGSKDGQDGIYVLDQDRQNSIREKFIPFDRPGASFINRAESYSIIRKGK